MQEEKQEIKKKLSWAGLRRLLSLLRFMWPKRWAFFGGLGALAVSSLGTLAFPMLLGDLLDAANPDASLLKINQIALILLAIFAINAVFSYFRIYLFAIVTQFMLARLRQTTYNQLIRLPMSFFSERRVGELNSRITADIAVLQETFTFTIAQFIRQLIIIVGGISLLTLISYKLTLFMLAFVPLVAVGARIFGKKVRNLSKDAQSQVASSNVIVEETLQGINNVKAFNNENYETTRYFNATNEVIRIALQGAKWRALFISLIVFSLFTSIVGVIWFGVYLVNQGAGLSSGDLFKFILYTLFIGASISGMADLYSQVQKAIGATDSLLDILEESTELDLKGDCEEKTQLHGNVSFENVVFSYPSRPEVQVLKGINFDVEAGRKIALVGASGAGKTTITALLFRFYEPDSGTILLDGFPANEINLNCLRRQMAIVPQEVLLFGGTIFENIAYGNTEASEEEITEAARKANALEFIHSFPMGFQTVVGERGVQLSGGQKQRIAIARAILRDPRILVLDEATSALDTASESLVQAALNELMKGRTAIIIAHRLSTIREADSILVIDQGRIAEAGSHEELLARDNGKYLALQQLAV
ncbi:MAG: ABC transporter transmembrane domain-containing protein [Bacteroidales bacterium]|nr:ABC transporter transmembrane domain-containing protein [Bacteroidales bacterium]HOI32113.1 ABC transporter transmembrane domain-containing protein [Bacteroidales bacterium]